MQRLALYPVKASTKAPSIKSAAARSSERISHIIRAFFSLILSDKSSVSTLPPSRVVMGSKLKAPTTRCTQAVMVTLWDKIQRAKKVKKFTPLPAKSSKIFLPVGTMPKSPRRRILMPNGANVRSRILSFKMSAAAVCPHSCKTAAQTEQNAIPVLSYSEKRANIATRIKLTFMLTPNILKFNTTIPL